MLAGRRDAVRREYEIGRMQAHELAQLMAIAFHQPKSLPRYEPLGRPVETARDAARAEARREADFEAVRAWFRRRARPK